MSAQRSGVSGNQRYTGSRTCPICGGSSDDDRGNGQRCYGYIGGDRKYAHCTREDFAHGAPFSQESETFYHILKGECLCGETHGEPAEPKRPKRSPNKSKGTPAAEFDYRDESETLLFQVCKFVDGTGAKTFMQRHPRSGGGPNSWDWGIQGIRRVLYRLPELGAADRSIPVYIVEGEKDVDRLRSLGLVATCNPMGAGKWRTEFAASLVGRTCYIIPDHDDKGRDHADQVVRSLEKVAAIVKVIDLAALCRDLGLPELPVKGDASDFLNLGGRVENLRQAFEDAPVWKPLRVVAPPSDDRPGESLVDILIPPTDLGNAARLVRDHGDRLRFAAQWGKWLCWDGQRWKEDLTSEVFRLAEKSIQGIGAEASGISDKGDRTAMLKWAVESQSAKRINAMVHLARFNAKVVITTDQLDQNPWLLNCRNGTIDLRTGQLLPHNQADLMTKMVEADYNPAAICPRWDRFLTEIMDGDSEMVEYLCRIVGYGITADVSEHVLFFFYGGGRNGKSLLLNTIQRILGSYATTINASLLTAKRQDDHPTELMDLEHARFVSTIEVADGKRMAETLVKQITGGDFIKARRMHRDPHQFAPTHKLILAANHKPEVAGTDEGIWERIKLIPFPVTFVTKDKVDPEQKRLLKDKSLDKTLMVETSGILARMVRSCLEWQRDGLGEPAKVAAATAQYRADMDEIARFFEERCILAVGIRFRASALYEAYSAWSRASNVPPMSSREFGGEMEQRGYPLKKSNSVAWRIGIGVREEGQDSGQQSTQPESTFEPGDAFEGDLPSQTSTREYPEVPGKNPWVLYATN